MPASRQELFAKLGLLKVAEPAMRAAATVAEEAEWRRGGESPHGALWHTSFHASSFPGDDPRACLRYQQYVLLDAPDKEPAPMRLMAQAEVGKAVELMLVRWFGGAGTLLSADQTGDDEFQTNFKDPESWLTGSVDLVIVPPGWNRPHVIEVKTKKLEAVQEMQAGQRGPDAKHVRQCKTYIDFVHDHADWWPDLKPCQDGSVFYLARTDDPSSCTAEFFYGYHPDFGRVGRERLGAARDAYLEGDLLPHPFGGKEWSQDPCKFCKFKKNVCKPDDAAGITRLRDSHANGWAAEVRGKHDYDETRRRVIGRWGAEDKEASAA